MLASALWPHVPSHLTNRPSNFCYIRKAPHFSKSLPPWSTFAFNQASGFRLTFPPSWRAPWSPPSLHSSSLPSRCQSTQPLQISKLLKPSHSYPPAHWTTHVSVWSGRNLPLLCRRLRAQHPLRPRNGARDPRRDLFLLPHQGEFSKAAHCPKNLKPRGVESG